MFLKLFGDANKRYIKSLQPLVDKINALENDLVGLSLDELKNKSLSLKEKISSKGDFDDDDIINAFALVREASKRTLGQRHFDVQLLAGIVLHKGQVAEMKTGEGKTLSATLAVYLNALMGKGVHVVTVNDYLSRRDAIWMGQIYSALGLSVSCLQHEASYVYDSNAKVSEDEEKNQDMGVKIVYDFLQPVSRKQAYLADITYGTNNEYGFDYLRDNMVYRLEDKVQREHYYAVIDEVDSILIDEARTPLIISGPAEEAAEQYVIFAKIAKQLQRDVDYKVEEKHKTVTMTDEGIARVEKLLGVDNFYQVESVKTVHHLQAAVRAEALFKLDKEYVVRDGEIIIVDEFTGRLMPGRRYSEGLHQAIEAKEGVKIQQENITMATITLQNYFRMYEKLSGMTGTAATEAEELAKIYKLDVTVIPTNKTLQRQDNNDRIYKNEHGKFKAIVNEIKECQQRGQPMLIGTVSIEKNEKLSKFLEKNGIEHSILNAKNHEQEAAIIAQAGRPGAVTLATNMAGRGVDIILGGLPFNKDENDKVKSAGGLYVLGTERHESRRIDNQLRGRAGRQGDPGTSCFFVSLDDELMRVFGTDRMRSVMNALNVPDDMPVENKIISKSIESAQKRVEGYNFDTRKHLVEYDDVINKQRTVIYQKRNEILSWSASEDAKNSSLKTLKEYYSQYVDAMFFGHEYLNHWEDEEKSKFESELDSIFGIKIEYELSEDVAMVKEKIITKLEKRVEEIFDAVMANAPVMVNGSINPATMMLQQMFIRAIDANWVDHLEAIDYLRTGINLRGYAQQEPIVAYKKESFELYQRLLSVIRSDIVETFFRIRPEYIRQVAEVQNTKQQKLTLSGPAKGEGETSLTPIHHEKIGRNDDCPCGSGKKYKKCHGQ